jgi:hypothetical protein
MHAFSLENASAPPAHIPITKFQVLDEMEQSARDCNSKRQGFERKEGPELP